MDPRIVLSELTTEITTDPSGLGYARHIMSGSDASMEALMNTVSESISISKETMMPDELVAAIDWAEIEVTQAGKLRTILSTEVVQVKEPRVQAALAAAVAAGNSRTRLAAVVSRPGTRTEELWGENVRVHHLDIAQALGRF